MKIQDFQIVHFFFVPLKIRWSLKKKIIITASHFCSAYALIKRKCDDTQRTVYIFEVPEAISPYGESYFFFQENERI